MVGLAKASHWTFVGTMSRNTVPMMSRLGKSSLSTAKRWHILAPRSCPPRMTFLRAVFEAWKTDSKASSNALPTSFLECFLHAVINYYLINAVARELMSNHQNRPQTRTKGPYFGYKDGDLVGKSWDDLL